MRRAIPFLILVASSALLAACGDVSAPRRDDPYSDGNGGCRSGYIMSSGRCEPVDGGGV